MTRTPPLKALADRYVKNLSKSAAAAPLKPTVKPPTLGLGGNSGAAKIPSLVSQPKVPTLSNQPISNAQRLGEGTSQQVQQTAQNLTQQPQQAQQQPAQPQQLQQPQAPLGPLGVPVMSKTGFLSHWAGRRQYLYGADIFAPSNRGSTGASKSTGNGVDGARSEDGRGSVKLGNETPHQNHKKQDLVSSTGPGTSPLFKRGFERPLTSGGLAAIMVRQWRDLGLSGPKLTAAIKTAAARYPELFDQFVKLADSPLKIDDDESPLKTESKSTGTGTPKLDTTPPAGAPKVVAPPQSAPGPKPPPAATPTPPPAPTPPTPPATATPPAPGGPGGEAKVQPDYSALNSAYGNANTAYQQAHAKWLELQRTKPNTPEEAAAWEALPGLQQKIDQAHQARVPYMGEEYAAAKSQMGAAAKPYDDLIAQRVPSTDPRYQAAASAYHAAKAKHDQLVQRGIVQPTNQPTPGTAKPNPEAADPFAGYGEAQPDPNAYKPGTAPRWSNMFQKAPGQDLHALSANQSVADMQRQWGGDYAATVTKGLREKFLPWMQQTGGAGLGEWAGALDEHQRVSVRLGLTDELVRVEKELAASTAWAKDPNKVKEYESVRGTILDPSKRGMFDGYVKAQSDYKAAEAAWMDKYKQGIDDPNLYKTMVSARQVVDQMGAAGVNDATHHWYQTVKKSGDLTAAKQAYQQAYAQVNYTEYGASAPVDLKAGLETGDPNNRVGFRGAMRGTERQRAAYIASLDYSSYRKQLEEEAKVAAEAETARRVGPGTTMGGDVAAKWQESKNKIYKAELDKRLSAIPDEAQFYHGRNLLVQQAMFDPTAVNNGVGAYSQKGFESLTNNWFRPRKTEKVIVTPATHYQKTKAVYGDKVLDEGQVNPYSTGAKHFHDRYFAPVVGLGEATTAGYQGDAYARSVGTDAWATGFSKADDATRAAYADRLSMLDRSVLIYDLTNRFQDSARAGDTVGAEKARQAAVYIQDRFNKQLAEFKANPHNVNLERAWEANGAEWVDKGIPAAIQAHVNSLNPAMRGYIEDIGGRKSREYYNELRQNNDPRYQVKYDPAFGYEFIDRMVLNAGAAMAPIYRTAARGVGAFGDGPGRDWLGGDTAQLKAIMDDPNNAHRVDWSGKPGEISNKLEDIALDAGITALTVLPVGAAANMGRGMAMMMGGLGGSSAAMAGVEMSPIDAKYKPALRVVAGVAGGVGGGWAGGASVGSAQRALQAYGSTGMVRQTTQLARVEANIAELTKANKPIPADLAAKQTALKTELDGMRAAGGEKLVQAENAQKAAYDRLAALEARAKDPSLSPAYRANLTRSPEYQDAVKALRTAEKDLYGVYKGIDASKIGPVSAPKPAAGAADEAATARSGTGVLDDAVAGAGAAAGGVPGAVAEPTKSFLQRWGRGWLDRDAWREGAGRWAEKVTPSKEFINRWTTGWQDRNAWREGLDRWTKGLSPDEALKRVAQSNTGWRGTGASHLNVTYNAERLLNNLMSRGINKWLPESWKPTGEVLGRLTNAGVRSVVTPFRFLTGEGAFYNAMRGFKGRTLGYGTAPFLPYLGNKLDEGRVHKPDLTPGALVASFLPQTNWLAQFGTTAWDKIMGNRVGAGVRDQNLPTFFDEWNNNLKAVGVTKDLMADLAQGSETAKIKFRRAGEELPSFFKNKAVTLIPSVNSPDQQISIARKKIDELEAKSRAATTDEERAAFKAQIDEQNSLIEENRNRQESRPSAQLRDIMSLENKMNEIKALQAAMIDQGLGAGTFQNYQAAQAEVGRLSQQINQLQAAGQPIPPELQAQYDQKLAPYMEMRKKVQGQQKPEFVKLQNDLNHLQKAYDESKLTTKEKEWIGRERRDLDQYKAILDRTGGMPTAAELAPKYVFPDTMEGRQRRAAVEAWKAKTSARHEALSQLSEAKLEGPDGAGAPDASGMPGATAPPGGFTVEDFDKFDGDYQRALVSGDPAQAKAVFDAALKQAGGDASKLPMEMMVRDIDHSMFDGMQPQQFGAMIDQGLGAGTFQNYQAAQAEVGRLSQQINQLQAAGQPIPPELQAQYDQKLAPYMEMRKKVQGQALAHYESTVMKDLRENHIPAFQKEYDEIKKLMADRPPGSPLDPDTQARLVGMRERGQAITQKYTDFAMRKAIADGGFKEDGTPIKSVQDFLGEANRTQPVLGAYGKPLMQFVRQPDGTVVQQPVTEPATRIGKEIKARIDSDILQRIQGQQTGIDAQGRPIMEHQVPPEIGAGIFGNMTSMEKMLTFGGLGLGVVGIMGAMFGFGGAWLPILGLLGAAFGGHKMTGGDFSKLFQKDFWSNAMKSPEARNKEVLTSMGDRVDSFTGVSAVGAVGLDSLKQLPQYNDLVAGKLPSRQAVQYLAALQPQDRARFAAELQATQPGSPLLPMIKQVDQFHANRQDELHAIKEMNDPDPTPGPTPGPVPGPTPGPNPTPGPVPGPVPGPTPDPVPGAPGVGPRPAATPVATPKPGPAPRTPVTVSKATNINDFAAEYKIPMVKGVPDLSGKTLPELGQMVSRMSPDLRRQAVAMLYQQAKNNNATWDQVKALAREESPPAYLEGTPQEKADKLRAAKKAVELMRLLENAK